MPYACYMSTELSRLISKGHTRPPSFLDVLMGALAARAIAAPSSTGCESESTAVYFAYPKKDGA